MERHTYLAHHGIKGMKWGVRRFQNRDGSYTSAGKSRYSSGSNSENNRKSSFYKRHEKAIKVGATAVVSALAIYGSYKMYQKLPAKRMGALSYPRSDSLKSTLSNYSTKSITIPPGTKFYRISREAMEDYGSLGSSYVSYKLRDAAGYVSASGNKLSFPGGSRDFLHTMTSKSKVKAPSARDMAKIYLSQHPDASDQNFRMMFTYGFVQWADDSDPMVKVFKKQAESFKKAVLSEGFNAIIDLEDANSKIEAPLILLSPRDMSVTSSKIGDFERIVADALKRR